MKKLFTNLLYILIGALSAFAFSAWYQHQHTALIEPTSTITPDDLQEQLKQKPLKHLGIIMDGNRRWAKKQGFKPWLGHKKGVDPVKESISFCLEYNIAELTLYVFSLENFKRPQEELNYLFDVLAQEIASKEFGELMNKGVRIRFVGDRERFPAQLVPIINDVETKSATNTMLTLNLLFCYGGQQELVAAASIIANKNAGQATKPITREDFVAALWSAHVSAVDLIVRTGGDRRLSNFLPVQSAYSELYFLNCYWPELTRAHLVEAVNSYVNSKRNFGA